MFKSVDKKLEEIGFKKVKDDEYAVTYERKNTLGIGYYIQVIDILHKKNEKHIVQSYDKDLFDTKGIGNSCVGLTYYEMKLILKKMRKKGWY